MLASRSEEGDLGEWSEYETREKYIQPVGDIMDTREVYILVMGIVLRAKKIVIAHMLLGICTTRGCKGNVTQHKPV